MAWKDGQRCERCKAPIGKSHRITIKGIDYPNKRKACLYCGMKGCLKCMKGDVEHGVLYHIECPCKAWIDHLEFNDDKDSVRISVVFMRFSNGEKKPQRIEISCDGTNQIDAMINAIERAASKFDISFRMFNEYLLFHPPSTALLSKLRVHPHCGVGF